MEAPYNANRNYSSISPSAKALLLLKGLTQIPYAKQAAELISAPEPYKQDIANQPPAFWGRVVHFESRYWSIGQLLQGLDIKNILELSSGFSFRGLEMAKKNGIHYIDTDLPGVIDTKKKFAEDLQNEAFGAGSTLSFLPLNALDEPAFNEVLKNFPAGELAIVNEGLLMYLGNNEKEKLCSMIRTALSARGGCWITADIYIKQSFEDANERVDDKLSKFFEEHHIRDNMFDSFAMAKAFFREQGFVVDKEAMPEYEKLSTLPQLIKGATPEQMQAMQKAGKIQATWRLKLMDA